MAMSVFVTPSAKEAIVAKLSSSTGSDGELDNFVRLILNRESFYSHLLH
jgi:hypothetical protein